MRRPTVRARAAERDTLLTEAERSLERPSGGSAHDRFLKQAFARRPTAEFVAPDGHSGRYTMANCVLGQTSQGTWTGPTFGINGAGRSARGQDRMAGSWVKLTTGAALSCPTDSG